MPEFSLAQVLHALPRVQLTLLRPAPVARVKGVRQTTGDELATPFWGNVQPTTPAEIAKITGGEVVTEAITIFTSTELQTANSETGLEADRVMYDGHAHKVRVAANWARQGFRKYIAARAAA